MGRWRDRPETRSHDPETAPEPRTRCVRQKLERGRYRPPEDKVSGGIGSGSSARTFVIGPNDRRQRASSRPCRYAKDKAERTHAYGNKWFSSAPHDGQAALLQTRSFNVLLNRTASTLP